MTTNKDTEVPERIWINPHSAVVCDHSLNREPQDVEYVRADLARVDSPAAPTDGVEIIRAERQRHFDVKGWTPDHDDAHVREELAQAAACYAWPRMRPLFVKQAWPWQPHEWKPEIYGVPGATQQEKREARIHVLAKAGALIAAEIDRLRRIK